MTIETSERSSLGGLIRRALCPKIELTEEELNALRASENFMVQGALNRARVTEQRGILVVESGLLGHSDSNILGTELVRQGGRRRGQ